MPYFFDNVDKAPIAGGPQADQLVAAMSGALVSLAYTGDPNHDELPKWPRYTLDDRLTMVFDATSSVQHDPFGAERLLWEGVPLGALLRGGQSS